jgi:hypothetical protein
MHITPVRRLAAGATATAILAAAFLIPAAVAVAEENTDAAPPTAIGLPGVDAAVLEGAAGEQEAVAVPDETLASTETVDATASAADEPRPAADAAPDAASGEPQLAPTALSTDDPQDPEGEIAPGETFTASYTVAGAKMVYAYVIGADLTATLTRADGSTFPLDAHGSYLASEVYWVGQRDGTWTLRITNNGTAPVAPEYGLSYSTATNALELSTSASLPHLSVNVQAIVDGMPRAGLSVQSEVTAADGTVHRQAVPPVAAGSAQYVTRYEGLPDGTYLLRVWTDVDGVTLENVRTVDVHALETDPPSVVVSTLPETPNAAGWFRGSLLVRFDGSDTGSGYSRTHYILDDGPELALAVGRGLPISTDGEHNLRFRGVDNQGNFSDWQETTLRYDATAPVISLHGIADGGRYAVGEELFVEYQCGDATSGLVGDDCIADLPDGARVDTTTPGDYTFTIRATDLAGNTTRIVRSYSVVAPDTTDPVVDVDVPAEPASGWYLDTVTVRFTASDESGIRRIHYEYDTTQGTVSRDIEAETAEVTFDRSQYYTLSYWAEDNAGNRSEGRDLHLYVDATAPWINLISPDEDELSILPNGHFAQNERVVIDFTCDDDASGIASCDATTPDGELLPTGTPGTHELRIVATDVAGHRTERVVSYTVDAAPAPNGNGGVVGPGAPRLASTGAEGLVGGVALAVLLLGAGAALAIRRRVRTR